MKLNSWFANLVGKIFRLKVTLFDVQTLNMQRRWLLQLMLCEWEVILLVEL